MSAEKLRRAYYRDVCRALVEYIETGGAVAVSTVPAEETEVVFTVGDFATFSRLLEHETRLSLDAGEFEEQEQEQEQEQEPVQRPRRHRVADRSERSAMRNGREATR